MFEKTATRCSSFIILARCAQFLKLGNLYFSVCLYIFLGNFPLFSVHKSLKILEKYVTNFFKGYINYLRANQMSSQVHLLNLADLVLLLHLQFAKGLKQFFYKSR